MSLRTRLQRQRRWQAPEVIQTSVMDCGPAALKCLLEGFFVPVSYGRLREACQTSVDGTSIDVVETVARQLGLDAEQRMLPKDHLWVPEARALPAMVATQQPGGGMHFVVVWRRQGKWVQVMDPGRGRRWTTCERFAQEIFTHHLPVAATDWYAWATSPEHLAIMVGRLRALGVAAAASAALLQRAQASSDWRVMATLDAGVRFLASLATARRLMNGTQTCAFLEVLITRANRDVAGVLGLVPGAYWSVTPANDGDDARVVLRGAVLLRIAGRTASALDTGAPLAPELVAALTEPTLHPMRELWGLLRVDGALAPLAACGTLGLAVAALAIEALLFRGSFELARDLDLVSQRVVAFAALLAFVALLWTVEFTLIGQSMRFGRRLEIRLRLLLLAKLPRLADRYFQSRPISDIATRSHGIYLMRYLPELTSRFVRTGWDLLLTLIGIACLDVGSLPYAIAIAVLAVALLVAAEPALAEGDMRMRSQAAALHTSKLDALLGIVPIRTHSAERAMRREHEGLLVEWARSSRSTLRLMLMIGGAQSLICTSLAVWLLVAHVNRVGATGDLLLLAFWVLKLPALGEALVGLAAQYPAYRNSAARVLEPIKAPEETTPEARTGLGGAQLAPRRAGPYLVRSTAPIAIEMQAVDVVAAGHTILRDVTLSICPGEHVAIVGASGAGKSSLLGLLLGWHRPAAGSVSIDGEALTLQRLPQLRAEIAWVDPAVQLWNRSLLENLHYASSAGPDSHLSGILDAAQLTRMLARLPDGLQTLLADAGASLSGGEGQRVRLGRALWQEHVRLALLDEPFRGLDREQRQRHLTELRRYWSDITLLCVTHDVRETRTFHRVLVIVDGRIAESGHPEDLAARPDSHYRRLLDVEESLRHGLWNATLWRHLRLDGGRLRELHPAVPRAKSAVGNE